MLKQREIDSQIVRRTGSSTNLRMETTEKAVKRESDMKNTLKINKLKKDFLMEHYSRVFLELIKITERGLLFKSMILQLMS